MKFQESVSWFMQAIQQTLNFRIPGFCLPNFRSSTSPSAFKKMTDLEPAKRDKSVMRVMMPIASLPALPVNWIISPFRALQVKNVNIVKAIKVCWCYPQDACSTRSVRYRTERRTQPIVASHFDLGRRNE